MKREFAAVLTVLGLVVLATWLLAGTGILTGFSGMFFRVLIGFAALGLIARIFCRTATEADSGTRRSSSV